MAFQPPSSPRLHGAAKRLSCRLENMTPMSKRHGMAYASMASQKQRMRMATMALVGGLLVQERMKAAGSFQGLPQVPSQVMRTKSPVQKIALRTVSSGTRGRP